MSQYRSTWRLKTWSFCSSPSGGSLRGLKLPLNIRDMICRPKFRRGAGGSTACCCGRCPFCCP